MWQPKPFRLPASAGQHTDIAPSKNPAWSLIAETGRIVERLDSLIRQHPCLPSEFRQHAQAAAELVRKRLHRRELHVAVVGEKKAGKSTFLNAILGARVLPSGEREMTGTVTYLRTGEIPDYSYVLVSGEQRRFASDCPDRTLVFDEQRRFIEQKIAQQETFLSESKLAIERAQASQLLLLAKSNGTTLLLSQRQQDWQQHQARLDDTQTAAAYRAEAVQATRAQLPTFFQQRPPIWAVWWWLWGLLLSLFYREGRGLHRAALAAYQEAQAEVFRSRRTLSQSTIAMNLIEQSMGEQQQQLHRLQNELAALSHALTAGTAALAELGDDRQRAMQERSEHQSYRQQAFFRHVDELCNMQKRGSEVRELSLCFPSALLPADVVFLDTPGVNTDNEINEERSLQAISEADTCILLTSAKQAMSARTRQFLETSVLPVVPHLILVLTKIDAARDDACEADGDVDEQLQETIDIAVDKFARSMGRQGESVLGFAVAAHRAIAEDRHYQEGYASQFGVVLDRLLHILHVERSHALGVRASRLIDQVLKESDLAIERAMESYHKSISDLQQSRLPSPQAECRRITEQQGSQLRSACARLQSENATALQQKLHALCSSWLAALGAAATTDDLKKLVEQCHATAQSQAQSAVVESVGALQKAAKQQLKLHLNAAATEVRQRYQIVQAFSGVDSPIAAGDIRFDGGLSVQPLDTLNSLLGVFSRKEDLAGGMGMGAGAAIGTMVMPGLGTAIGAGVGLLLGALFGPNLDLLKRKLGIQIESAFESLQAAGLQTMQQAEGQIVEQGIRLMSELLADELRRFNHWIDDLLRRKETEIATAKARLADLKFAAAQLEEGRLRLSALIAQCTQESLALARVQPDRRQAAASQVY